MKKYLIFFVILSILTVFSHKELQSQPPPTVCPPGTTSSISTTFTVRGCVFNTTICWKCGVTSAPLEFGITYCEPANACVPFVSREEAMDSIYNQLLNPTWLYFFCFTDVPPCSTLTTKKVRVIRYNCYRKYTPAYVPPNPQAPTRFEVCSYDSYCYNDYEACMISLGNMQLTSPLGWQQYGIPDCLPMPEPMDPLPGYGTDCWLVNPGCDHD